MGKAGGFPNFCPPAPPPMRVAPPSPIAPRLPIASLPPVAPPAPDMPAPQPAAERCDAPGSPLFEPLRYDGQTDPNGEGLLCHQGHWYLSDVGVKVRNELLSGMPIGLKGNTLCLINKEHRYFIPLRNIDYIRTFEGLESSFESGLDGKEE